RPPEWAVWRRWRRSDFWRPTRWKASPLNKSPGSPGREAYRKSGMLDSGAPPPAASGGRPGGAAGRGSSRGRLRSIMDWDKLKVFHAAAEAGSFTHAGEQLGLSQSAVSRQVSALEQELTVALFHRHARGLILTEQGEL